MSRKYFGTDGIRGPANVKITPELALKIGQAAGLVCAGHLPGRAATGNVIASGTGVFPLGTSAFGGDGKSV